MKSVLDVPKTDAFEMQSYPPGCYSLAGQTDRVCQVARCPRYVTVPEQGKSAPSDRPPVQFAGGALGDVV